MLDPENDPLILALEREDAYKLAAHHQELREQAERELAVHLQRIRMMTPRHSAFVKIQQALAGHIASTMFGDTICDAEFIEGLMTMCRQADAAVDRIIALQKEDTDDQRSGSVG